MSYETDLKRLIEKVAQMVSQKAGIILGPKQYPMIENRLKSRVIKLGLKDILAYEPYLQQHAGEESEALLSLMTTHHTFFFREFSHFEFLRDQGLAQLVEALKAKGQKRIKIWSAACSRGQEVYSLAMFLSVHLKALAPDFDYEIWGTDIDPESIQIAQTGSYPKEDLKSAPQIYLANHWRVDPLNPENLKAGADLKSKLHFKAENLLDLNRFLTDREFDIIFCRNVFIYFEKNQIEQITKKFLQHLNPQGYLFLGVSESITNYGLPLQTFGTSIYGFQNQQASVSPAVKIAIRNPKVQPYRVLVVDDSKTIHALMKKIFVKDHGFEIVHAVLNGQQALDYLAQSGDRVELITLDLHMPEVDGLSFLKQFSDRSKPILVVSAVDRDDSEGPGQQALKLGAFDYVEKPTVENLEQIGNEIRSKLTTGLAMLPPKVEVGAHRSIQSPGNNQSSVPASLQKPLASSKKLGTGSPLNRLAKPVMPQTSSRKLNSASLLNKKGGVSLVSKNGKASEMKNPLRLKKSTGLVPPLISSSSSGLSKPKEQSKPSGLSKPLGQPKSLGLPKPLVPSKPLGVSKPLNSSKPLGLSKSLGHAKPLRGLQPLGINKPLGLAKTKSLNKPATLMKPSRVTQSLGLPKATGPVDAKSEVGSGGSSANSADKIRVLVVDDSATVRKLLVKLINSDSRMQVVGETAHPLEVEKMVRELKPQLMTLDIHMPDLDGVTLLKKLFPVYKIPTVMISSISIEESHHVLDALESGAVDYIQKPSVADLSQQKIDICDRLFTASKAKAQVARPKNSAPRNRTEISDEGLIVIGSSTGGTEALRVLFESLPSQIPPILVTQHIPPVFSKALAERLNTLLPFEVREAQNGDTVKSNTVYIAPGGKQMGIFEQNGKIQIRITDDAPVNRHKPSVDYLFDSVVTAHLNINPIIGVILTGMGGDGARGLKRLRDQGAITIGQDEASSIVYGMPKVAFDLGAVEHQLSLNQIGAQIIQILSQKLKSKKLDAA